MIRLANEGDIGALMRMGAAFHAASPWRDIPLDVDRLEQNFRSLMTSETSALFITDDQTGTMGLVSGPIYFANAVAVQETFWWCENPRHALSLLNAAEQWAREIGADQLCMIRLEGMRDDQLHNLYARRGFSPTEHVYVKAL